MCRCGGLRALGLSPPDFRLRRLPSWGPLLARASPCARSSLGSPTGHPAPWAGSILGKISVRGESTPGAVLARAPREAPGRCLQDRGHREPERALLARVAVVRRRPRGAAAGGRRPEQPQAAQPAPARRRGLQEPPRLTGAARRGVAASPHLRGRRAQRTACGCRQGAPASSATSSPRGRRCKMSQERPTFYRQELNKTIWEVPERYQNLSPVGSGAYGSVW